MTPDLNIRVDFNRATRAPEKHKTKEKR